MNLKEQLDKFIERVCSGKGSDAEVTILPDVLDFYGTLRHNDEHTEEPADTFPTGDTLVNAAQAAEYLGFTQPACKIPAKAVHRLSAEGKLHAPVRIGDRTPRWEAQWIRDFKLTAERESEKSGHREI